MVVVEGRASYLQGIALPPDAVFTVRIEDVSRAGAPSRLIAEVSRPLAGAQAPLSFKLAVAKSKIEARSRYSLRATIHVEDQLRFTSTQSYPVLSEDASNRMEVKLQAVGASKPPQAAQIAGLDLPQSFAGVLACADCAGIAHTLTLLPDGVYRMRLSYLGKAGPPFVEQGRWSLKPLFEGMAAKLLGLSNEGKEIRYFLALPAQGGAELAGEGEASLRQLDRQGRPFASAANMLLRPTAAVDPID